jgi:hypothetical protein
MAQHIRPLAQLLRAAVKSVFQGLREQRRPRRCLPGVERLETRINPATFSESGPTLTVRLTDTNEGLTLTTTPFPAASIVVTESAGSTATNGGVSSGNVTGFGTGAATINAGGYAAINIQDTAGTHGGHVTFGGSSVAYTNAINIDLSDGQSGNITFNGFNLISSSLSASTVGGMALSSAGSSLFYGSNLTLMSGPGHTLELLGAVIDVSGGAASASLIGNDVNAVNTGNSFSGAVSLHAGGAVNLFAGGDLNLGASNFTINGTSSTSQITAAGTITQTGALVANRALFAVLGDAPITLTNPGNAIAGSQALVAFDAPHSGQAVQFTNSSTDLLQVGGLLGRGAFSVTTAGNITGGVNQAKGAGPATFTTTGRTSVALDSPFNDFTGPVQVVGAAVTAVRFINGDPQARLTSLTLPAQLTDLTVIFPSAPVVLPTLSLTNLSVSTGNLGMGIYQQPGSHLTVSGAAFFFAGGDVRLDQANDFNTIQVFNVFNDTPNNVTITDTTGIVFSDGSQVGAARLTVSAGGSITEAAGAFIIQPAGAGPVLLQSANRDVVLDQANRLTGPVSIAPLAAGNVTLRNGDGDLLLGDAAATGTFTATADNGSVLQAPGTALQVAGSAVFTAKAQVALGNRGNRFTGTVALSRGRCSNGC